MPPGRPMPALPRGPRARPAPATCDVVVPRVSPQRAAHERRVLVKPHDWTRAAVAHRMRLDAGDPAFEQPWDDRRRRRVAEACRAAAGRLSLDLHDLIDAGAADAADAHFAVRLPLGPLAAASLAVAACASAASPGTWVQIGKLAARDARFFRREHGRLLNYRPAPDVHLSRDVRSAVRDLLKVLE